MSGVHAGAIPDTNSSTKATASNARLARFATDQICSVNRMRHAPTSSARRQYARSWEPPANCDDMHGRAADAL